MNLRACRAWGRGKIPAGRSSSITRSPNVPADPATSPLHIFPGSQWCGGVGWCRSPVGALVSAGGRWCCLGPPVVRVSATCGSPVGFGSGLGSVCLSYGGLVGLRWAWACGAVRVAGGAASGAQGGNERARAAPRGRPAGSLRFSCAGPAVAVALAGRGRGWEADRGGLGGVRACVAGADCQGSRAAEQHCH